MAQPTLAIIALVLVTVALIGQAIEMRKIRIKKYGEGSIGHPNIFLDKKNFKWYALIGIGFGLAFGAQFF
ncbi:MAG TPA: hypothetical protein EYQ87_00955 [Candidatus Nitrosopelagicus sp.]|nr:hypothetical protein [Candidatus Nitrosopelagicus sp.]